MLGHWLRYSLLAEEVKLKLIHTFWKGHICWGHSGTGRLMSMFYFLLSAMFTVVYISFSFWSLSPARFYRGWRHGVTDQEMTQYNDHCSLIRAGSQFRSVKAVERCFCSFPSLSQQSPGWRCQQGWERRARSAGISSLRTARNIFGKNKRKSAF